ncbi:hypothetical protein MHU86_21933 [Fragilaria crotonensis]|nr:hypothetical protein MHU86_21933 [Fragilaria crotonensis]
MRRIQPNRPKTYKKRPAGLDHHTCDMNLNIIARKLECVKANNGGVTPYGAIRDIVKAMKPTLPWLSTEMVRFHMRKLAKAKNALTNSPPPPPPPVAGGKDSSSNDSAISSLTSNSTASTETGQEVMHTEEIEFSTTNGRTNRSAFEGYTAAVDDDTDVLILGGRPSSTNCSIREAKNGCSLRKSDAAKAYRRALDERKDLNTGALMDAMCVSREAN